jgi:hypothetical protein
LRRVFYSEDSYTKIFGEIIAAGRKGIYQKELLVKLPEEIDRTTVFRNANKLKKERLIKIIRKGKTTRYVLAGNAFIDKGISAYLLNMKFVSHLLGKDKIILSDKVRTYPSFIDYTTYRRYFEPKFTQKRQLEKTIFEFSNQLGAFITYIFIHAMNPDKIKRPIAVSKKKKENIIKKDRFVSEEWVKTAISSRLILMLRKFRDCIKPFGYIPDILTEEGQKKREETGYYLLDKKSIDELFTAFGNVYTRLKTELDEIMNSLPELMKWFKKQEKYITKKYERQDKCYKHDYSKSPETLKLISGKEKIGKECSICGKWKSIPAISALKEK